eukprot:2133799-Amphidinium_carterae.1
MCSAHITEGSSTCRVRCRLAATAVAVGVVAFAAFHKRPSSTGECCRAVSGAAACVHCVQVVTEAECSCNCCIGEPRRPSEVDGPTVMTKCAAMP